MSDTDSAMARGAKGRGIAAGVLVGTIFAGALGLGAWRFYLVPLQRTQLMRFETHRDVWRLYGLQKKYFARNGAYASDLDALLALDPDGARLKTGMPLHLDMATLAIIGAPRYFKIEANVLDGDRTLVKVKGPIAEPSRKAAPVITVAPLSGVDDGAPLTPGR